ncbi:LuxR family transcriptional regulator [Maritimibacter sp. 55A14]|uniref:helix-turn-helix transcriptional regulator n=1 Tax=Maritimibacter sp. 55A14 TaxID=2174844 RepID=UPI000D60A651|nr:LuxR family transcriptional regulator [Maritimibacter sp. 55A14]PWE30600.1 LuxR family transcriptional regulator [Maritimibacter sp. 55A14]
MTFIGQLCERLELDYASYATLNPVSGTVQGYANYPDQWKLHYMSHEMHRFDPTLHMSARSIAPVDWSRFRKDDKFHAVFGAASDFGISAQGLSVPVRGPFGDCGLLNVTRDCSAEEWGKLLRHIASDLQTSAVHIHDAIMRSDVLMRSLRLPKLSSRETEILQWTAAGKTQTEIGDILSISYRTVEVHLRSAREKLGALSTSQAVGRAIGLGFIRPS